MTTAFSALAWLVAARTSASSPSRSMRKQVEAGHPRGRLQVGGGPAAELQHGHRLVDHHARPAA